jgi:hypothetical protein
MLKNIILSKDQTFFCDLPTFNIDNLIAIDQFEKIQNFSKNFRVVKRNHPDLLVRKLFTMDLENEANKKIMKFYLNAQI